MIKVKCLGKLRDGNNRIYGYTLQDEQGNQMNVQADALKNAIRAGQVKCINLYLTDNNRLIDNKSPENTEAAAEKIRQMSNKVGVMRINGVNTPPSMYGISIKNVKTLTGREGAYYSGTIYKNGTKLGDWSQSPYGAIVDDYYFDETELDDAVKKWLESNGKEKTLSKESFMNDLVILADYFKMYEKIVKKGHVYLVVVTDDYDINVRAFSAKRIYKSNNELLEDIKAEIHRQKISLINAGYTPVVKIFSSQNDFIIQ